MLLLPYDSRALTALMTSTYSRHLQCSTRRSPFLLWTFPFPSRSCQECYKPNISTSCWSIPPLQTELTSCQWHLHMLSLGYRWSLPLVWACTSRSMCPFCPDTVLDPLGHHAVACRHDHTPWDVIFDICRRANLV